MKKPPVCGVRPDNGPWRARPWLKLSSRLRVHLPRSRRCQPRPRCAANRSELQVAVITPLFHVKGYAAPETKAAVERAHLLIEQAEALGEPPEDPLLLFSVLYWFWGANFMAFNGDVMRELAAQFLAIAKKHTASDALMIGYRLSGSSLLSTGNIIEGTAQYDKALALYDPVVHRPLAIRFGQDVRVATLCYRSMALWLLGYPEAGLADAQQAIGFARKTDHAATLMYALALVTYCSLFCGKYPTANALLDELALLADEKGASFWKACETVMRGTLFALTNKASDAVRVATTGIAAIRSTGTTATLPWHLSHLAQAYAELGEVDRAWHYICEAMSMIDTTNERWWEADVHRIAGDIALMLLRPNRPKAETHFERALAVARQQQAKSWELRAAMSLARLWRDQGKVQQARELLAPVYGWFTEGFDTRDLKEAKALLDDLAKLHLTLVPRGSFG